MEALRKKCAWLVTTLHELDEKSPCFGAVPYGRIETYDERRASEVTYASEEKCHDGNEDDAACCVMRDAPHASDDGIGRQSRAKAERRIVRGLVFFSNRSRRSCSGNVHAARFPDRHRRIGDWRGRWFRCGDSYLAVVQEVFIGFGRKAARPACIRGRKRCGKRADFNKRRAMRWRTGRIGFGAFLDAAYR